MGCRHPGDKRPEVLGWGAAAPAFPLARAPTYLASPSRRSRATPAWQLHHLGPHSLPGPGWGQLHLWAAGPSVVCPSVWGRAGAQEEGARGRGAAEGGRGLISMRSPWPLSAPPQPHCEPGRAHNHRLCGGLAPALSTQRGRGPGPPPASKGRGRPPCPRQAPGTGWRETRLCAWGAVLCVQPTPSHSGGRLPAKPLRAGRAGRPLVGKERGPGPSWVWGCPRGMGHLLHLWEL